MESDVVQYGGRASFESPVYRADGSVRFRKHDLLPPVRIDGSAALRVPGFATFAAELRHADWGHAGSALAYDLRAQTDAFQGKFGFAEIAGGKRGAPSDYFRSVDSALVSERKGLRAGLGIERWGARASGAYLKVHTAPMPAYGLPFDTTDDATGERLSDGLGGTSSVPL